MTWTKGKIKIRSWLTIFLKRGSLGLHNTRYTSLPTEDNLTSNLCILFLTSTFSIDLGQQKKSHQMEHPLMECKQFFRHCKSVNLLFSFRLWLKFFLRGPLQWCMTSLQQRKKIFQCHLFICDYTSTPDQQFKLWQPCMQDNSGDLHELFRSHDIHHMNCTQQLTIQDALTCMVLINMKHVLTFHESKHIADENVKLA